MQQHEFIWVGQKYGISVILNENGICTMELSPRVHITHNYKRNNQMILLFTETQDRYLVHSKSELIEIVSILRHVADTGIFVSAIRDYCEQSLQKIQ